MKAVKFIALLLLVVLTTSGSLSIYGALNDSQTTLVVCENTNEEEQREEKEEVDNSEYFLLNTLLCHTVINTKGLAYFSSCKSFSPIDQDDIFEPPENSFLQA